MNDGYIYCARNPYMLEDIHKVGCTARNEKDRLSEANSNTWSIPEWKFLIVKRVANMVETEKLVHKLLASFELRITDRREFFKVPFTIVQTIFDLITEIPMTTPMPLSVVLQRPASELQLVSSPIVAPSDDKRPMPLYFDDNMLLIHRIASGHEWRASYDLEHNKIIHDMIPYDSPSAFATAHVLAEDSNASGNRSGWTECKTMINGELRPIKELPRKN